MMGKGVIVAEREEPSRSGLDRASVFARLADRQLASAYRLASLLLGSETEAQDAVQDAAVVAWERFAQLRDRDRFDPWFQRILVNGCRDRLRGRGRVKLIPLDDDPGVPTPDPVSGFAEHEALQRAVGELPGDQRTVIVLRYLSGLTLEEIADRTGERLGTVKSRLHYGLQALRAAYDAAARLPGGRSR